MITSGRFCSIRPLSDADRRTKPTRPCLALSICYENHCNFTADYFYVCLFAILLMVMHHAIYQTVLLCHLICTIEMLV